MMASLPLTITKCKGFGCLLGVNRKITALRDICDDPEKQEQDRVSTATAILEEAWRKYDEGQQDILGLTAEDHVGDELVIFLEMEDIYEAAIDRANKISKKDKDSRKRKGKTDDEDEGGKKSDTRPDNPTQDGGRQDKATKHKALVDNPLDPNTQEPPAKENRREKLSQAGLVRRP